MHRLVGLMKYKLVLTIVGVMIFSMVAAPMTLAQGNPDTFGLDPVSDNIALGDRDLRETAASIINVALSLLGIVAVVIILIGGFQWMTAGGNDEKVSQARKLIFSGIIGLAIILSAWAIARFVIAQLSTATESGTVPGAL